MREGFVGDLIPYRRRLLLAQFLDDLSVGVVSVALPLLIFVDTGDVVLTSLVYAAEAGAALVFSLAGGVLATRYSPRRHVSGAAVGRALLLLSVPCCYAVAGPWAVVAASFGVSAVRAYGAPFLRSALAARLGAGFERYVAHRAVSESVSTAAGPAVGGYVVALGGAAAALYVGSLGLVVVWLLILAVAPLAKPVTGSDVVTRGTGAALLDSFRFAMSHAGVRTILVYWFVSMAALPIALVNAIPYLIDELSASTTTYGVAVSVYALGSVVSAVVAGRFHLARRPRLWLIVAGLGYGGVNLAMLTHPPIAGFLVLWLTWGLFYGPESVVSEVAFIRLVPEDMQSRLYAVMSSVFALGGVIGSVSAGALGNALGPAQAMGVAGAVFVAATLGCFVLGSAGRSLSPGHLVAKC